MKTCCDVKQEAFSGAEYDPSVQQMTAFPADKPYNRPSALNIEDDIRYIQPWNGFVNECNLDEEDARRLPCQTANIKPSLRYAGMELNGNKWMELACHSALLSVEHGGGPFSTVIVQIDDSTNRVIRYRVSWNRVTERVDPTAHGETTAIRQACKELGVVNPGRIRKDDPALKLPQVGATSHCELYISAAPCPMCSAATRWDRIDHIFFAATVYDAAIQGVRFPNEPIYAELSLNYRDREKMGVHCFQCTTTNSLDAFNFYKRSGASKY